MKTKPIVIGWVVVFILAGCVPAPIPAPTETATPSQTPTSLPPSSTPTWLVPPKVTATPLNLVLREKDELDSLIKQSDHHFCVGANILTPPATHVIPPPTLKFTELNMPPDQQSHYVREIADNIDNSLQAYIACEIKKCADNIYVKDNKTGKVYEVYFGATIYFALQGLTWVNKDTFIVSQMSSPVDSQSLLVAVDFSKREYLYYGTVYRCSTTPTP